MKSLTCSIAQSLSSLTRVSNRTKYFHKFYNSKNYVYSPFRFAPFYFFSKEKMVDFPPHNKDAQNAEKYEENINKKQEQKPISLIKLATQKIEEKNANLNRFIMVLKGFFATILSTWILIKGHLQSFYEKGAQYAEKEQLKARTKGIQEKINQIVNGQVNSDDQQVNFHYRSTIQSLTGFHYENMLIYIESAKFNNLSAFLKGLFQKFNQQNKNGKDSQNYQKSKANRYDEYKYVNLRELELLSQQGIDMAQQFYLYLKNLKNRILQQKKKLLFVIDSFEMVQSYVKNQQTGQKVNIQRLFRLLKGIQKSGLFTIVLISYDPYFFENNLVNLNTFKEQNFLFQVLSELNKEDVKELVRKYYSKQNKQIQELQNIIANHHNSSSEVHRIINSINSLENQQRKGLNSEEFKKIILERAEKTSEQIINENKRIVERSLNKIFAFKEKPEQYDMQMKEIKAKKILLSEINKNNLIQVGFFSKFNEIQQRDLYSALRKLNSEEILFKNRCSSVAMKEAIARCFEQYLK